MSTAVPLVRMPVSNHLVLKSPARATGAKSADGQTGQKGRGVAAPGSKNPRTIDGVVRLLVDIGRDSGAGCRGDSELFGTVEKLDFGDLQPIRATGVPQPSESEAIRVTVVA